MSIARKIFLGRVTLPALTASSLLTLMRDSNLHWGFETTALATPSFDSIIGSEAGVVPDATIFVGIDSTVNDTNGYQVAAGVNFSLQDFGAAYGVIDPNQIYFYNQSGCGMNVAFTAR